MKQSQKLGWTCRQAEPVPGVECCDACHDSRFNRLAEVQAQGQVVAVCCGWADHLDQIKIKSPDTGAK